ncbi:cold shock domain-containing protein [Piscinibacter sakaiensis]|uniref:cold-shock protein n=2 Tax=Piscinibacter sakaiensis TaxID=1547922 RepID=UPI003727BB6C
MTMPSDRLVANELQQGTVARLNPGAGFGYVRDAEGRHSYIFVIGRALKHSQARTLTVGKAVRFRVSGQGRVDELVVA